MTEFDPRTTAQITADFIAGPKTVSLRAATVLAHQNSGPRYVKQMFAYTSALKPAQEEGRPVFYGLQWGTCEFQGNKTIAAFNRLAAQAETGFETKEIVMLVEDLDWCKPPTEVALVLMAPRDARIFDVAEFRLAPPYDSHQSPYFTHPSAQIWVPFSPSSRDEADQPAILLHRPTPEGAAHARTFLEIAVKNRSAMRHG